MTGKQKQRILNEVQHHKLADCRIYAYIRDGEVIFSNFEPPRGLVEECAVIKYGAIDRVIRY